MSSSSRGGGKISTQWRCSHCQKYLSSKRSYREHMNVHNEKRPFQCDTCGYAAASAMTLRRHRLRLHIPRSEWGYPCPYCTETYMEPASYEQHVSRRHFGQSCTYGCPHQCCTFTSKSSRHFLEHISRHHKVIIPSQSQFPDNMAPDSIKASYYLIDDEIGSGYGKPPLEAEIHRYENVLALTKARPKPTSSRPRLREAASTIVASKIISPASRQPRTKSEVIDVPVAGVAYVVPAAIADDEEVIYEEAETEEDDVSQYYELVDENGISVDNQYYKIEPDTEEYLEDDPVVVGAEELPVVGQIEGKLLLKDGQVDDIDLD